MKLIERQGDVITGDKEMEDLHTMRDFPIFMGCVNHSFEKDIKGELTWQINKN